MPHTLKHCSVVWFHKVCLPDKTSGLNNWGLTSLSIWYSDTYASFSSKAVVWWKLKTCIPLFPTKIAATCRNFTSLCEVVTYVSEINTLRPRQNGRLFADDTFKRIFLNENDRISIKIALKFVPKGLINNIPALVMIMAWRRPGDKPLSEPMVVRSLTHICVTRPQWVKWTKMIACRRQLLPFATEYLYRPPQNQRFVCLMQIIESKP